MNHDNEMELKMGDFYITATDRITQVQLPIGDRKIHVVVTARGKVEVKTRHFFKENTTFEHLNFDLEKWLEDETTDDGEGDRAYEMERGK